MSDIVAQLEVLSRESGCLIDISAILNLSICPKVEVITDKPHVVEEKDDVVCITPTPPTKPPTLPPTIPTKPPVSKKPCNKLTCYEVHEEVCEKPTVALDLQVLVLMGLLSQEDLEKYLKTTGALHEGDDLLIEDEDVGIDPWLSDLEEGEEDGEGGDDDGSNLLDLEVGDEDGLITLDLLGKKNLLVVGGKDGKLLDLNLRRRGLDKGTDRLLDVDILGEKDHDEALIDADILTYPRRRHCKDCKNGWGHKAWGHSSWDKPKNNGGNKGSGNNGGNKGSGNNGGGNNGGNNGGSSGKKNTNKLLDLDIGGKKDKNEALIDLDVLTHSRRQTDKLLDLDVLGEKDKNEATIDLDVLTTSKDNTGDDTGDDQTGGIIPGKPTPNKPGHWSGGFLTHYQPICKKGFRAGHRDDAEKCHAQDVNHCLAICHSHAATLTLDADVKVGDVAHILLCAAIEFNKAVDGDNCRYFVAPEGEPCNDDELEVNDDCVAFVRN